MIGSRRSVIVVFGFGVVLLGLIGLMMPRSDYSLAETLPLLGAMAYFLVLGSLIILRVPGNRIGWVFASMAVAIGVAGVTEGLADRGMFVLDVIGDAAWMFWIGAILLLVFWYPTGRAASARWRWAERLVLGVIAFASLGTLFSEEICVEAGPEGCAMWEANPIGIEGMPYPEYWEPFGVLVIVTAALAFASLIVRYRRSTLIERLQLKWFLLTALVFFGSIVVEMIYDASGFDVPIWVGVVSSLAILAIPVAATMAILRYRLYEIDRIISRTVSYALVVGVLGLVVLASITLFAAFLPSDDPLVVAVSTLAAAALFNPVRRRVQSVIDHRFNRSRYDAQRVVGSFTETLQEQVDPDEVIDGLVVVVTETMQPSAVAAWVRR